MKVYKLNVFTKKGLGGNPAAVVLNADNLREEEMKKIAKNIGFSETAFVLKSKKADFKTRFFTPLDEVDICGHATLGTFAVLLNEKMISKGIFTQETMAGKLKVFVGDDNTVMMEQSTPKFFDKLEMAKIAMSLRIGVDDLSNELPIQIVSTGLKDILVPVKNEKILNSIKPNFNRVADISKHFGVVGYHIFSEMEHCNIIKCRNLAPLYGIDEECATGTSNGALAAYLYKYNKLKNHDLKNIIFEQGHSMNRDSQIIVSLENSNKGNIFVKVGGKTSKIAVEIM